MLAACGGGGSKQSTGAAKVQTVATNLEVPWEIAFMPDGRALALYVLTSNGDGRGDPADDDDRILKVTLPG